MQRSFHKHLSPETKVSVHNITKKKELAEARGPE